MWVKNIWIIPVILFAFAVPAAAQFNGVPSHGDIAIDALVGLIRGDYEPTLKKEAPKPQKPAQKVRKGEKKKEQSTAAPKNNKAQPAAPKTNKDKKPAAPKKTTPNNKRGNTRKHTLLWKGPNQPQQMQDINATDMKRGIFLAIEQQYNAPISSGGRMIRS